jgi:hypothetical protein
MCCLQKTCMNVEVGDFDYTNTYRALRLNPRESLTEWLADFAMPLPESRYPTARPTGSSEAETPSQEVQIPREPRQHGSMVRVGRPP